MNPSTFYGMLTGDMYYWKRTSKAGRTQATGRAAAAAKSFQSCPTLGNPIDGSPPGSPVPGILQARTLEWVAISFYKASVTLIPKIKTLKTSRT